LDTLGLPRANRDAVIEWVTTDGYQTLISDGTEVYKAPVTTTAVVAGGDAVTVGQPLVDTVSFLEYPDVLTASAAILPGLALNVPLSTGRVAPLVFVNTTTEWTYDATRPSPFRFPVSGETADVEQFWVDSAARQLSGSVDLQAVYGLTIPGVPGPTGDAVNPMQRIITDLLQTRLYVVSVPLTALVSTPGGFHDRARLLMPTDVLVVLHQGLGSVSDAIDLGTVTSDSVSYGYNTTATTEVISVSGTDLTFFDHTPLVVIS